MAQYVHLMVGVPGTGKSTWINSHLDDNDSSVWISRDQVRAEINSKIDSDYFAKEKEVFRQFTEYINKAIEEGYQHIYVDATHINTKSRAKVLRECRPKADTILICEVMDTSLETAEARNEMREGWARVPKSAIEDMWSHYSAPTPSEFRLVKYGFADVVINHHGEEETYDLFHFGSPSRTR